MGHPDAAYDLPPDAQARLLGWLYARAGKRPEKPKGLSGQALFDHVLRGGR
jgi:hypothetical protein